MAESAESAEILSMIRVWRTSAREAATQGQNQARALTDEVVIVGEPCKMVKIETKMPALQTRPSEYPGAAILHAGICDGGAG